MAIQHICNGKDVCMVANRCGKSVAMRSYRSLLCLASTLEGQKHHRLGSHGSGWCNCTLWWIDYFSSLLSASLVYVA